MCINLIYQDMTSRATVGFVLIIILNFKIMKVRLLLKLLSSSTAFQTHLLTLSLCIFQTSLFFNTLAISFHFYVYLYSSYHCYQSLAGLLPPHNYLHMTNHQSRQVGVIRWDWFNYDFINSMGAKRDFLAATCNI